MPPESPSYTLTPIGFIHTEMRTKFEAPSQPDEHTPQQNIIELLPGHSFEQALRDLEGFDRIWVVSWFHRNTTWRPMVRPPRGKPLRRGVFATRAPHRPNPIGISALQLLSIDGLKLTVGSCDLVDGTPILDIKPYIRAVDSFPDAASGWLSEIEETHALPPCYTVRFQELATLQLEWLQKHFNITLQEKVHAILSRDPSPHRTRRIARYDPGLYRLACGPWRIFFTVTGNEVEVIRIGKGFKEPDLHRENFDRIPFRDAQVAFGEKWPEK